MNNKNIYEVAESLGIGLDGKIDNQSVVRVESHFEGNDGYYYVIDEANEYLLFKGIHKDFVRILKGEKLHKEKIYSKISDMMSQIAKNVDYPFYGEFQINEKPVLIKLEKMQEANHISSDKRRFVIRRPLSTVEYNMGKDDFASDKMIYSKGLTADLFPETLSPITASMLKKVLDIINPFFMHANFKTFSPSIKLMFNKLYINYSSVELIFRTLKMDESFLQLNYAPYLYSKNKKVKLKSPNMKLLDISTAEVDEFMLDIKNRIKDLTFKDLTEDSFHELLSMIVMCGILIFFLMIDSFISTRHKLSSWSETLKFIYKTRENSIFSSVKGDQFPKYFDIFSEMTSVSFGQISKPVAVNLLLEQLPLKTRILHKKNILKLVEDAHFALGMRDELFIETCNLVAKVKDILIQTGNSLIKDRKFSDVNDLKYFDIDELKDIVNDNYFGNIPFAKYFKYWQTERFKMQAMPSEIYEKDIGETPDVIGKLYNKLGNLKDISCVSYFHKDIEGICSSMENRDGPIVVARTIPFVELDKIRDAKAVVVENCSIFSFLTEYAAIMDIPVYTGVRFAPLLLDGKSIFTAENKIVVK